MNTLLFYNSKNVWPLEFEKISNCVLVTQLSKQSVVRKPTAKTVFRVLSLGGVQKNKNSFGFELHHYQFNCTNKIYCV